jgi:hypothetical protein
MAKDRELQTVVEALKEANIISPDVTVADLLKATQTIGKIVPTWTAVVDSDKWAVVLK